MKNNYYNMGIGVCLGCSKTFTIPKAFPEQKYCSRKCAWGSAHRNKKISNAKQGDKNNMWKGDSVGYAALHTWVAIHFPKPNHCSLCGAEKRLDLANISNEYKRDLSDWEWLCRLCHMTKDGRMKAIIERNNLRKIGNRNCLICRKEYRAKHPTHSYCSKSCAATATNLKRRYKKAV